MTPHELDLANERCSCGRWGRGIRVGTSPGYSGSKFPAAVTKAWKQHVSQLKRHSETRSGVMGRGE